MITFVLAAVLVGNIGSAIMASLMLKLSNECLNKITRNLNASAGGTLVGAAFLGMSPNAIKLGGYQISYAVLESILFFFVVEKIMLWRICSDENCDRHSKAGALMLMIGDLFHNLLDGIVVAISVFAHEIPQEVADFGVMIKAGLSKLKTVFYNLFSGLTAIVGALLAWYSGFIYKNSNAVYLIIIGRWLFIHSPGRFNSWAPSGNKGQAVSNSIFTYCCRNCSHYYINNHKTIIS